jgi:hypothetical protein
LLYSPLRLFFLLLTYLLSVPLQGPHLLRLYFRESGGFDFHQAVQELRERLEVSSSAARRGDVEPLRVSPSFLPPSRSVRLTSYFSAALYTPSSPPSSSSTLSPLAAAQPERDQPTPSTLQAAAVARAAEEAEAEAEREERLPPGVREGEAPPGYEA